MPARWRKSEAKPEATDKGKRNHIEEFSFKDIFFFLPSSIFVMKGFGYKATYTTHETGPGGVHA